MITDKKFLTGPNVTFVDFCVYDSISSYEAELSPLLKEYYQRVKDLTNVQPKDNKISVQASKML